MNGRMTMPEDRSTAWPHLRGLVPGDRVPAELYVLDDQDGTRPRWMVHSARPMSSGGVFLVLVDPDDGVALTVLTWPHATMRSQPHQLGEAPDPTLCDMDQQGRYALSLVTT